MIKDPIIPNKVVILHGTLGFPDENWFPWLADSVEKLGHEARVPRLPTPMKQTIDTWLVALFEQVEAFDRRTIIVGHSLGAAFALRALERTGVSIKGLLLVSAFRGKLGLPQFDPLNESFFSSPFDWETIRALGGLIQVYHGDDDPIVPLSRGREIAEMCGGAFKIVPRGGHLNAAAGYLRFEILLNDLQSLLDSSGDALTR